MRRIKGIFRRGNIFWLSCVENGTRIQQSLGTGDYLEAVAKTQAIRIVPSSPCLHRSKPRSTHSSDTNSLATNGVQTPPHPNDIAFVCLPSTPGSTPLMRSPAQIANGSTTATRAKSPTAPAKATYHDAALVFQYAGGVTQNPRESHAGTGHGESGPQRPEDFLKS